MRDLVVHSAIIEEALAVHDESELRDKGHEHECQVVEGPLAGTCLRESAQFTHHMAGRRGMCMNHASAIAAVRLLGWSAGTRPST